MFPNGSYSDVILRKRPAYDAVHNIERYPGHYGYLGTAFAFVVMGYQIFLNGFVDRCNLGVPAGIPVFSSRYIPIHRTAVGTAFWRMVSF